MIRTHLYTSQHTIIFSCGLIKGDEQVIYIYIYMTFKLPIATQHRFVQDQNLFGNDPNQKQISHQEKFHSLRSESQYKILYIHYTKRKDEILTISDHSDEFSFIQLLLKWID